MANDVKTIKHFNLPEHTNTLYKNEAKSSIALTKEIANKINELVDSFNTLQSQKWEKIHEQDGKIRSAILYMKDNLLNTINDLLNLKGEQMIDNSVKDYLGSLKADINALTNRLENLLGSVSEGSTTMDAEVIDLRVGADGKNYTSAGESVRTNIKALVDESNYLKNLILNGIDDPILEEVEITDNVGYILNHNTGALTSVSDTKYKVSNDIEINPGEFLKIRALNHWENFVYVFLDENKSIVKGLLSNNVGDPTYFDGYVIVPKGAKYLRISEWECYLPSYKLEKLKSLSLKNETISNNINILNDIIFNQNYTYSTDEVKDLKVINDAVIPSSKPTTYVSAGNSAYKVSDFIEVEPGEIYHVVANGSYGNGMLVMVNESMDLVSCEYADPSVATRINKVIQIPKNVKYIRIAYATQWGLGVIEKVSNLKLISNESWSNKKWVAFGDSLTEVNNTATTKYHDLIKNDTGISVLNYGKSGSGYWNNNNASDDWKTRVLTLKDVSFDVITFFGSGNDIYGAEIGNVNDKTSSTLAGCINLTLDNLFSIKPFAKVGIITPTPWKNSTPSTNNKMKEYSDMLIEIAKSRGIPYLDLFRSSTLNPNNDQFNNEYFYNGDGCHPNNKGHLRFVNQIKEFIKILL